MEMTLRNLMRVLVLGLLMSILPVQAKSPVDPDAVDNGLLVLSYHDIRDDVREKADADAFAVSTQNFAAHLDWLSAHDYHPISLSQLIKASQGKATLPPRAVLLTFDDGLRSMYTRVYPLLRAYHYPALVAVITDYVDMAPDRTIDYGYRPFGHDDFLTWDQLREMLASGLIEVASHTDNLHHGVQSNPYGNQAPAVNTRIYDPTTQRYEDVGQYAERLRQDLARSVERIAHQLGVRPRAIVWPYAAYNQMSNDIAEQLGMPVSFDLEGRSTPVTHDLHGLARLLVTNNPTVTGLAFELRRNPALDGTRALQIDLDSLYDSDPAQQARNLDTLIDRVKRIGPTHVYLQAFADPDGNNTASALYFPNRHMPMREDLFNRVAWQLKTRAGVKVYAWLPVLGYELPDLKQREALRIHSTERDGMYRLDFTNPQARQIIKDIYEDLAINSYMEGILFHDDGYLRDTELPQLPQEGQDGLRTQALIDFTMELRDSAQRWRPKLSTVRNLYAQPVLQPQSAAWFAQRLDLFNRAYDRTALMAMPWMEGSHDPERWLDTLVAAVRAQDPEMKHTLFELQTVDWHTQTPISGERLIAQIHRLQSQGVRHFAWYPDDFIGNRPSTEDAHAAMSARNFPYPDK
ncbi:poly-beta-1,6-N-acetyl-D-glucosamine N-deacetylase PgaB [Xanthomonas oryzae]|uniref:Biofilm PGA synthesis lipoprotein PgaB n=1 Tax=Xanthomonas oryzae pv. oryzicola (strain BLS256) TaxID=383407 RepID=G7TD27_XANOB|nr:poly-beta-1,6-N-acetyl-D-glucosamine N-deacetylase PgaB [Xanthomonas oryzae]AEQ94973.1 biofilm PGA synthesis lipoprotein PgaB [Xanthomonas oryzae pv. oryzicola BLS256]AKO18639.1 hemin storage protein [Xanthomonas oryzae pv. oryzicola]PUE93486.1 poly-beta-1,6-N-acetyl-D-glucosamine N-deacetylase PgaB [Xanthomonas oryzae pv. oryzicola]WVN06074.1 poly-beta-1,6-N-acetyl-D-glucosamine N-deacetylase PgaB [Xanthomonas oryzae pv. oryzicola]